MVDAIKTRLFGAALALAIPLLLIPASAEDPGPQEDIPPGLACLLAAYPDHLCGARGNTLIWCDGTELPYDEGKTFENYEAALDGADLKAQMSAAYKPGLKYDIPPRNHDPGRLRSEAFFKKMYGADAKAVSRTLKPVTWMPSVSGRRLLVTRVNGVDKKLKAVSDDLEKLPADIKEKIKKTSGTFVWRTIKGSDRLSMHSFAMAVDVGVEHSDYWKWSKPKAGADIPYRNRFPVEVAQIFERHGFIWGGKWYHYDTMHFEYRPELLHPDCRAR